MNWTIFHQEVFPIRHKLFRFALRITGNTHDAEDVVQEVLEKVWKAHAGATEEIQNWEAWCMTLTRNRSLDKNRSKQLRRTTELAPNMDRAVLAPNPHQQVEMADELHRVRAFMQELPEKQRIVMHLRDIEELSYAEIAEVADLSIDQVKINLHRARGAMRLKMIEGKR